MNSPTMTLEPRTLSGQKAVAYLSFLIMVMEDRLKRGKDVTLDSVTLSNGMAGVTWNPALFSEDQSQEDSVLSKTLSQLLKSEKHEAYAVLSSDHTFLKKGYLDIDFWE